MYMYSEMLIVNTIDSNESQQLKARVLESPISLLQTELGPF